MTNSPAGDHRPPAGATPPHDGMTSFFNWFRSTGLHRSDSRWLGGVAGGIATRLGIDPLIVRGVFIVVAVLGGPALFLYGVAWALVPDTSGRIYLERAIRGIFDPAIIAIGALVLFTFVPFMRGLWWQGAPSWWHMPDWLESTLTTGWVLALIAVVVWLIVRFSRRTPTDGSHQPPAGPAPQQPVGPNDFWTNTANTGWSGGDVPTAQQREPEPTVFAAAATPTTAPAGSPSTPGFTATAGPAPFVQPTPQPTQQRTGWTSQEFREEIQRQREEQSQSHRERMLQRRHEVPGAGFIAISLGLALVAGALAAVFTVNSGQSSAALIVGIGAAVAVVALATVIVGVMGRQSGWLASFTWIGVIALLIVGVVPAGTQIRPFGTSDWTVSSSVSSVDQGFAMIAGAPQLDLRGLDAAGAKHDGTIDVWVGAGKLDVILPDDVPVIVKVSTLAGSMRIENDDEDSDANDRGGVFYRDEARFGRTASPDTVTVQVWMLAGTTHIIDENDRAGR